MTAPTQSPALAMREALELFVIATASAAGDDWDGVDQVARRMFERAHELANIALAIPIPDVPAPGADEGRLRKALERLLTWLKDKRLSEWPYMENGQFYADLRSNIDYLEHLLADSARPAPASEVDVMGLFEAYERARLDLELLEVAQEDGDTSVTNSVMVDAYNKREAARPPLVAAIAELQRRRG